MLFGGARGGGKTSGVLGKYGIKASRSKYCNAVFFRKELPQADDLIEEAREIYGKLGAKWRDQKKLFEFPTGSRVRFRPLENDSDAEKYQGQNITDAAVEEAGNYESSSPIDKLFGALRSKAGEPIQLILTANPGGIGQSWIKQRYIDPAPAGMRILNRKLPNGKIHRYMYIPSRVQDNRQLLLKDPDYINRLHLVGSPELVRAWLEGDWSVIEGAFFSEFNLQKHVIAPFTIPQHWTRYMGFDWGYHSPFCVVWAAISSGKDDAGNEIKLPDGRHIPKGAVVFYREWTDRKLSNEQIAKGILERCDKEKIHLAVADPAIFNTMGAESIGDQLAAAGVVFGRADNTRLDGWSQVRRRLIPDPAMVYFFSSCRYLIESIPALPIDKKKPEDLDTQGDDHGADAVRYVVMESLLQTDYQEPQSALTKGTITLDKYIKMHKQDRGRPRV